MATIDLTAEVCKPCESGVPPLSEEQIAGMLPQVPGWSYEQGQLQRSFDFKDFYQTISFVNAVAWLSNREGHHPVLEVGFRQCTVKYWTHAIDGMSENDFICAAKVNQLIA